MAAQYSHRQRPATFVTMERSSRRTIWLFGGLVVYIIAQFLWWGLLLMRKGDEVEDLEAQLAALTGAEGIVQTPMNRVWMILGEGGVFLVILLVVVILTYRAVINEFRMAATQRNFLLAVTHELRTPIAAIKLQLQTLKRPGIPDDQRRILQNTAEEEADRLALLTEKVLLASNDENPVPLTLVEVDVCEVIRSAVDRARSHAAMDHEVLLEAPEHLRTRIDPHALRSIVDNLVENATKYAPTGTRITVQVKPGEHGWRLLVSDEGPGIPLQERERVFERFYRIGREETRNTRGTGLGLYIVKRLVQRLGGTVQIRNHQPLGAIFAASFPHH